MRVFVIIFAFLCVSFPFLHAEDDSSEESSSSEAPIDNTKTTLEIMRRACIYPRVPNDEVAQQFMACYDEAPGKEIFLGCQIEAFGKLFDSKRNFMVHCIQVWKLIGYVSCLTREFEASGLNQDEAVFKVNACQLPVLKAI